MMKRIFMLLALALMVVAAMALSGVAQAASPKARCQLEAASLGVDLTGYTFVYGNNRNNGFTDTVGQPEVFCGLGGDDSIGSQIDPLSLETGDIFIGGAGNDSATFNFTWGTFVCVGDPGRHGDDGSERQRRASFRTCASRER